MLTNFVRSTFVVFSWCQKLNFKYIRVKYTSVLSRIILNMIILSLLSIY